ncbi:hypothetical protein ES705_37267 [subsurface metagenome]
MDIASGIIVICLSPLVGWLGYRIYKERKVR